MAAKLQFVCLIAAMVVMILYAVTSFTVSLEIRMTLKGQQLEIKGLHKSMDKVLTDIDKVHTEIMEVRTSFVSTQKGQSAAVNSALSLQDDDVHVACGTLAYSAR